MIGLIMEWIRVIHLTRGTYMSCNKREYVELDAVQLKCHYSTPEYSSFLCNQAFQRYSGAPL